MALIADIHEASDVTNSFVISHLYNHLLRIIMKLLPQNLTEWAATLIGAGVFYIFLVIVLSL